MAKFPGILLITVSILAFGCAPEAPEKAPTVQEISQQELLSNRPANALILDVRTGAEFESGHVPNALNIPHDQLASRLDELDSPLDRPVVVYCKSGKRAGMAAEVLLEAGYTDIRHLEGDMTAWQAKGLPTESIE